MSQKKEAQILKHLDTLTSKEAHLLVGALEKNAQTIYLKNDEDAVRSLVAKRLLEPVPDNSTLLYKPFFIPRFVWEHIKTQDVFQLLKTKAAEDKST